jgi:hypothetical protein
MMARAAGLPTERAEMRMLADWLHAMRVLWLHPPNEGRRHPVVGAMMKRDGLLQPGAPDAIIFERWCDPDAPAEACAGFGLAIELKRSAGGRVSDEQEGWLLALGRRGWAVTIAYGADDAIDWLGKRLLRRE